MIAYDRHSSFLFGSVSRFLGDRESAAEVVQDAFLTLWRRARQFDARSGSLLTWLLAIARNRAIDRLRAEGRRPGRDAIRLDALASEDGSGAGAARDGQVADEARHGPASDAARVDGRRRGGAGPRGHRDRRPGSDDAGTMSAMDHAAAHERIEDLLLEPARLEALEASTAPEDMALRQHLDGCPACRSDLESWRQVQRHVADALPASTEAVRDIEPIEVPPSLRTRVLAAVQPGGRALVPIAMDRHGRSRPRALWLGL